VVSDSGPQPINVMETRSTEAMVMGRRLIGMVY
ncbi:uncharacterized protein METZ01_LOCUS461852, partial [marine metagenome]